MAGLAQILKESGHEVSGSDSQFYPPMSDYIQNLNIEIIQGFAEDTLPEADLYVIGNALSRGNDCIEKILDQKLPFVSGPEILGKELKDRNVFAVSGTHGKTTTSYMLCHILIDQGRDIGYLVGGISKNMENPAKLGTNKTFVIEADEYDSAFFDKRSKFIHYFPSNLIINNIEFDHADIFDDLNDIKKQFHHLLKIIPQDGNIIYFQEDKNTLDILNKGNWSQLIPIGTNHSYDIDYKNNLILAQDTEFSMKDFIIFGSHNAKNVISAIAATNVNGASIEESINALKSFQGVKRRLELKYQDSSIIIIDDFAHHPTAIKYSIDAVRKKFKDSKIIGLIELGSNTMSDGIHGDSLVKAASDLDSVIWIDEKGVLLESSNTTFASDTLCINALKKDLKKYDILLIMTNKNSERLWKPIIEYIQ